jgi:hypothetical protein
MEARPASETKHLPRELMSRLGELLSGAAADGVDDSVEEQGAVDDDDGASTAADGLLDAQESEVFASPPDAHQDITDCPVTCPKKAITDSMPRALRALGPDAQAARVWCTLCCIAVLERMRVSWIAGDGDLYPEVERTIVDSGYEWVAAQAAAQPSLAAALERGAVLHEARRMTALWHRAFEQRVRDLRRAEAIRTRLTRSHVHRAFTSLTRAFITKHGTLATFLSEPLDGLQRWQSAAPALCWGRVQPQHARISDHLRRACVLACSRSQCS